MNTLNFESNNLDDIHIPVMLNEIIDNLNLKPNAVGVDCTLGMGGHAQAILEKIGPHGKLIGIDRDEQALAIAKKRLKDHGQQCVFVYSNYHQIDQILSQQSIQAVDFILLDLGVSSLQLNDFKRGFSFREDGPVDMRMDQGQQLSAYDLVNTYSVEKISTILKEYGEERWHRRIAQAIVQARGKHTINTTKQLSEIILKAMPKGKSWQKIHPATRSFQAIRMAVNQEVEGLQETLGKCIDFLKGGGRIAVVSFHSLEDRIVKHTLRSKAKEDIVHLITKKPLRPTYTEITQNPRSRSARLRVAERAG